MSKTTFEKIKVLYMYWGGGGGGIRYMYVDKDWSRIQGSSCHEICMVLPISLLFERNLPIFRADYPPRASIIVYSLSYGTSDVHRTPALIFMIQLDGKWRACFTPTFYGVQISIAGPLLAPLRPGSCLTWFGVRGEMDVV